MSRFDLSQPRGACLHPDHGDRPATRTMRGSVQTLSLIAGLPVGMTVQMCDECYARANGLPWPPPQLDDPDVIDVIDVKGRLLEP